MWLAPLRFLRNVTLAATSESENLKEEDLEVGDLIEINRILYQHWAVYIGDGQVVHLVNGGGSSFSSSASSSGSSRSEVKIDWLSDIKGSSARKNNNYGTWIYGLVVGVASNLANVKPLPRWEIKERALSKVGFHPYDAFSNNCEHFAKWCRFGVSSSTQTGAWSPI